MQSNLVITPPDESAIQVDNLEVAQFIYLLLNNERIRARDRLDHFQSGVSSWSYSRRNEKSFWTLSGKSFCSVIICQCFSILRNHPP